MDTYPLQERLQGIADLPAGARNYARYLLQLIATFGEWSSTLSALAISLVAAAASVNHQLHKHEKGCAKYARKKGKILIQMNAVFLPCE